MFVETKREGEAPSETKPTLSGFVIWLGLQPNKHEKICVSDPHNCALERYYRSLGRKPLDGILGDIGPDMGVSGFILYDIVGLKSSGTNRTYGEAYEIGRTLAK